MLSLEPGTSVKYGHILQLHYECNCSIAATVKTCEGIFNADTLEGISVTLRVRHMFDTCNKIKEYTQALSHTRLKQLKAYCENEFAIIVAVSEQLNVSPVSQSRDDEDVMDMQQTLPSMPTHTAISPANHHCYSK